MNTNNENTPNNDAINPTPNDAINRIATRRDVINRIATRRDVINHVATKRDAKHRVSTTSEIFRPIRNGMLFALGFFGTTLLGVAISGTIKTWTSGEVLKSADLNTTISSMKTAIESIPNWTKASNGTDAYYTAGYVGIGTASPTQTLHLHNGVQPVLKLTSASGDFQLGVNNTDTWMSSASNPLEIFVGGTERMRITSAGAVGIGITSPAYTLHVNGGVAGYTPYTNLSDERYKKNVQSIESPTEKILKLRGVSYEWRQNEFKEMKFKAGKDIGFIGQEVQKIIPEAVSRDEKGMISLAYSNIIPVLVEAFKEQKSLYNNEKKASEKKLSLLEESNQKLKTENKRLQELVESHGRASLRLEERLNALEKMQIAQAAQAKK